MKKETIPVEINSDAIIDYLLDYSLGSVCLKPFSAM